MVIIRKTTFLNVKPEKFPSYFSPIVKERFEILSSE